MSHPKHPWEKKKSYPPVPRSVTLFRERVYRKAVKFK